MTPRPADHWTLHAACTDLPWHWSSLTDNGRRGLTKLFFPWQGEDLTIPKAICSVCPVCGECLDYAFRHTIQYGVWGGTSERERKQIRGERHRAAKAQRERGAVA